MYIRNFGFERVKLSAASRSADHDLALKTLGSVVFVLSRADARSPEFPKPFDEPSVFVSSKCRHAISSSSARCCSANHSSVLPVLGGSDTPALALPDADEQHERVPKFHEFLSMSPGLIWNRVDV
jgi:hypothetical protein